MAAPVILNNVQLELDPTCKVLKADDYVVYLEAQEIIKAAREQAAGITEEARQAYEQEKKRGYQEGLAESKAEQTDHMLKVVSRTINYLSDIENTLANILLSGVKKIIGEFDQEELAISLVKNALQHVRNEKHVTIRVPSAQYSAVQARLNTILAEYKGVGFIDLVADPRLSSGDCIMESEIGVVDASVDVQLRALQKRFDSLQSLAARSREADMADKAE
ncbi:MULTISPECIES: HrpE/YscL family type III secretion apparatus protein [Gammaproteobacteria]|uniref:HrpE/YscL family type III secretion apparatus protein n=1 Tax=Gammaproteobacteria TaxID=1236 RepID=UPI001ADD24D4|nr:HrpE/YscL family type III secretion apparatus protein [Salinisphaera sp. G21_0]MBO9493289.1 HrpE/YscL family type III secretion apparatus protein [Thalassotalea sp. G20_0]